VTDEIAESLGLDKPHGALVASVADKGPAQAAGIQPGDIVLTFDGKDITDMKRLPRVVAETPIDKKVPVTLWRKRHRESVEVTVGELKEDESKQASLSPGDQKPPATPGSTVKTLGLTLSAITPDLKQKFSLSDNAEGVVVLEVADNGAAAAKGLKPGDVIIEAAQQAVKTPDQVAARVREAKSNGRKSILLLIDRGGDLRFVALRIDQG